MKKTNWKRGWLLWPVVVGCMMLGLTKGVAQDDQTNSTVAESMELVTTNEAAATTEEGDDRWARKWAFKSEFDKLRSGQRPDAVVRFEDVELKTNQAAEAVVVIGGSAKVYGKVREAVVVIGGDATIDGAEVGEAVVAVLGNIKVKSGSTIHGEVVSVGGKIDIADDAVVEGHVQPVDFESFGLPRIDWLKEWLVQCVIKMRPLAFAPHLGWLWVVAGAFFLLYLLLAVALPKPMESCVLELTRRPATTFLMGLLTMLLLPVILVVLIATGIGVFIIPFLGAAVMFGAAIGKVGLLEYFGFSLGRTFGGATALKPVLALLIGSVLLTVLYLVPVLGLLTFTVTGMWGLGAAVMAVFGGTKREMPSRKNVPAATATPPLAATDVAAFAAGTPPIAPAQPTEPTLGGVPPAPGAPLAPMAVPPARISIAAEALTLPRASFWERMGAAFLDFILVCILGVIVGGPPLFFLVALAYFAGMWAWKGTTVGGVVLNLKVVRLDDQPVTFVVALVRGLAAGFSVIVLFLGFFWMIWDREKQTWHDKIAGTVVVRQPRGMPLVCL
ncbi:MAG: RDD family protein [Verrucomicrobiota bacterium]